MKELLNESHKVHLQNKRFSCKSSSESEESDSGKLRLTDFLKFFRFEVWKKIYNLLFLCDLFALLHQSYQNNNNI
jgi:hypothetical protein